MGLVGKPAGPIVFAGVRTLSKTCLMRPSPLTSEA